MATSLDCYIDTIDVSECTKLYVSFSGDELRHDHIVNFSKATRLMDIEISADSNFTSVSANAFSLIKSLHDVVFKSSTEIPLPLKVIKGYAFTGLPVLTSVTFESPSLLERIEDYAFYQCNMLVAAYVPEAVYEFSSRAYSFCLGIEQFIVSPSNQHFRCDTTGVAYALDNDIPTTIVAYPPNAKFTSYIIPEAISMITARSFAHVQSLTNLSFAPDSNLIQIESYAFYSCFNLQEIIFPKTKTSVSIEESAFSKCYSLSIVTLDPDFNCPIIPPHCFQQTNIISFSLNKHVVEIKHCAFSGCTSLIEFSSTHVQVLGDQVFEKCQSLKTLSFDESLREIGVSCFGLCSGLTAFTFHANCPLAVIPQTSFASVVRLKKLHLPHNITSIGERAFQFCAALSEVTFAYMCPIESLSGDIFNGCTSMKIINIPENVMSFSKVEDFICLEQFSVSPQNKHFAMDQGVLFSKDKTILFFYPPAKSDTRYVIPASVTVINKSAFAKAQFLTSIDFANISIIGPSAFHSCEFLRSVTLPESIIDIGEACFAICTRLQTVTLPSTLERIPIDCFAQCISLKEIVLPDSVEYIDSHAFEYCTEIIRVNISESSQLRSIGSFAFAYNECLEGFFVPANLTDVMTSAFIGIDIHFSAFNVSEDNPRFASIGGVLFNKDLSALIWCPPGTGVSNYTIPDTVTIIRACSFSFCRGFTHIYLCEGVVDIEMQAFGSCEFLEEITLPDSVVSIGDEAFADCYRLRAIHISENSQIREVGEEVIAGCWALERIFIPSKADASYLFFGTGLESLVSIDVSGFNKWYTSVDGVFYAKEMTSLILYPHGKEDETFAVPQAVIEIGYRAFAGNSYLKTIHLGDQVTTIEREAFTGSNIVSCIFPLSLEYVYDYAFANSMLETIGDAVGLKTIASHAFANTNLKTLVISGLDTLSLDALDEIESLEQIEVRDSKIYSSESGAFVDKVAGRVIKVPPLLNQSVLILPEYTTNVYANAFTNCKYITSIIFPKVSMLSSLPPQLFAGCTQLEFISVPLALEHITRSFEGAPNLKVIDVDANVHFSFDGDCLYNVNRNIIYRFAPGSELTKFEITQDVTVLSPGCFRDAISLEHIVFDTDNHMITKIPQDCFLNCINLKQIEFSRMINEIGDNAFENCISLTTVSFPNAPLFQSFGQRSFQGCTSLKSIIVPFGVNVLPTAVFKGCLSLSSITFETGSTLLGIDDEALSGCSSLEAFTIQKHVQIIGTEAFMDCTSIRSITFARDSDLDFIGARVFEGCVNLAELTLPSCVHAFTAGFAGCVNLRTLKVDEEEDARYISESNHIFFRINHGLAARPAIEKVSRIPAKSLEIEPYAYANDRVITRVENGNSIVESIFEYAFANCASLTYFEIGPHVCRIDSRAFDSTPIETILLTNTSELRPLRGFYSVDTLKTILIPYDQYKDAPIDKILLPFGSKEIEVKPYDPRKQKKIHWAVWVVTSVVGFLLLATIGYYLFTYLKRKNIERLIESMDNAIKSSLI